MPLTEGSPAPDFTAPDQDGNICSLADFAGSWLLLYFYPQDDTPGCTTEACSLRDTFSEFQKRGVAIVGVSTDPVKSHREFADKYSLPFTLLADERTAIVNSYGVWQEKTMFGHTYMGTVRSSFLIDPHGVIRKIYPRVKPDEHVAEILKDLDALA
jgi:thioredoxin-dependent peroxiredoxin